MIYYIISYTLKTINFNNSMCISLSVAVWMWKAISMDLNLIKGFSQLKITFKQIWENKAVEDTIILSCIYRVERSIKCKRMISGN